jgi:hypothetical protein
LNEYNPEVPSVKSKLFKLMTAACLFSGGALTAAQAPAELSDAGGAIRFTFHGSTTLSVVGPDGIAWQGTIDKSGTFGAEQVGRTLPDGLYRWEARTVAPPKVRGIDSELAADDGLVGNGIFRIVSGSVNLPDALTAELHLKDQVIPDDLIVQGSLCVGFDCVNNESFGFDTIRLKENNTRIKFEDTSTGTFPSTDWQLTANDSASGGQNKFSIEDITGARVPFTIEGGSTTNSIYVDSTGRVGFRTSTPVLDLHVNTSNTPGIRLEQNNSGGFTAQTWDIAGNEANFFVRDVTGGSRLSLRVRPGAPTSSLDIAADGDVGIGTGSPDASLHVRRTDATSKLLVEEASGTTANRNMFELKNNGNVLFFMTNTATSDQWQFSGFTNAFQISRPAGTGTFNVRTDGTIFSQFGGSTILNLATDGNLTIAGTLTQSSDRNLKSNIQSVDGRDVVSRLLDLPIHTWRYNHQSEADRHIGPMAQDFYRLFGFGTSDKTIAPSDTASVALAAAQQLAREVAAKDAELAALREQNESLEARLARLEARMVGQ